MYKLGDQVAVNGKLGRVTDIDPDDRHALLVETIIQAHVGRDRVQMVERASPLRHYTMRVHAFMLRVRDCGLVYALTWPGRP
jgi:hypothetical protein